VKRSPRYQLIEEGYPRSPANLEDRERQHEELGKIQTCSLPARLEREKNDRSPMGERTMGVRITANGRNHSNPILKDELVRGLEHVERESCRT